MPLNNEVDTLNVHNLDNDIRDTATRNMIAPTEKESYATNDYKKNQYLIWNDRKLYKATTTITHGDTLTIGGNIKYVGTLSEEVYNLHISSDEGIRELVANIEEANASTAYGFGDYIVLASDGLLYMVTTNVSLGTAWAVGTNIQLVDNVGAVLTELKQGVHNTQKMLATVEATNKASRSYEVGEEFIFNNVLYKATAHIEQQATLTPGTNCTPASSITSQFNELEAKIKSAAGRRKFILIGDSYGYGVKTSATDRTTGWIGYFASLFPHQTYYYNYQVDEETAGVASFTSPTAAGKGFETTLLWVKEHKLTDVTPEEITDVVVIGGNNNDTVASYEDIKTAVEHFIYTSRANFPNAHIKIGCLGISGQLQCRNSEAYHAIKNGAVSFGAEFMYDIKYLANSLTWDSGAGHLNDEGYAMCNPYVAQCIVSGHTHYCFGETIPLTVNTTDVSSDAPLNFRLAIERTEKYYHMWINDNNKYMGYYLNNVKSLGSGSHDVIAFNPTSQYAKIKLPYISYTPIDHIDILNKQNGSITLAGKGKVVLKILDEAGHFEVHMTLDYYFAGVAPTTDTLVYSWEGMGGIFKQEE